MTVNRLELDFFSSVHHAEVTCFVNWYYIMEDLKSVTGEMGVCSPWARCLHDPHRDKQQKMNRLMFLSRDGMTCSLKCTHQIPGAEVRLFYLQSKKKKIK